MFSDFMSVDLTASLYLLSGVFFILAIRGLSSPETARIGNYLGMSGMLIAFTVTILNSNVYGADYVLKLAHNGPEQHPFQNGAERFKQVIEEETDGAVTVQIFPGEQLGSEEDTSQMIKQGTIACAVESAGGVLAPFVASADLFNLPFLFRDVPHFYRVLDGPVGDFIARDVEENLDAVFLGWWFSGIRNEWNGKRPVMTPEDLKGLKIRVMGSPVLIDTFNALGAQATPMSWGEVYTLSLIHI